ncbi:unnamed protein product [Ranitomeya imitator]|uniref:Uncharacterized protein n=1 Tax=Ranitomeya imitator TaxID=111125 RepID=A0ABN9LAT1_9NEOB|nr:unnamed protein product [Ranitomeya imitator]
MSNPLLNAGFTKQSVQPLFEEYLSKTTQNEGKTPWRARSRLRGSTFLNLYRMGLENLSLEQIPEERRQEVLQLLLPHNRLLVLPPAVAAFSQLHLLDISNNGLAYIGPEILALTQLKTLLAKNKPSGRVLSAQGDGHHAAGGGQLQRKPV